MCKINDLPIGIFDSGAGGITVLQACKNLLPCENYIYYGDTKNSPYGNLSDDKITELTFAAIDKLINKGVKAVVIACNTATAAAITALRAKHSINIIGIEPAIKPACLYTNEKVLVLLTLAASRQPKFLNLVEKYGKERIIILPLEHLAELIEHNIGDLKVLKGYIEQILYPNKDKGIGALVLGCTHYLFVKDMIEGCFDKVKIFDGNMGVALNLKNTLNKSNLYRTEDCSGKTVFFSSKASSEQQYRRIWKIINKIEIL